MADNNETEWAAFTFDVRATAPYGDPAEPTLPIDNLVAPQPDGARIADINGSSLPDISNMPNNNANTAPRPSQTYSELSPFHMIVLH